MLLKFGKWYINPEQITKAKEKSNGCFEVWVTSNEEYISLNKTESEKFRSWLEGDTGRLVGLPE